MPQPPGFRAGAEQLRDPDFARLFSARFGSTFGTAMAPIAMAFGVLELTGSPVLMGLVIASQTAAQVVVLTVGGTLADRWSRQRLMVRQQVFDRHDPHPCQQFRTALASAPYELNRGLQGIIRHAGHRSVQRR